MRTAGVLGLLALWQGAAVLLGPRGRLILPPPRAVLERLFALRYGVTTSGKIS